MQRFLLVSLQCVPPLESISALRRLVCTVRSLNSKQNLVVSAYPTRHFRQFLERTAFSASHGTSAKESMPIAMAKSSYPEGVERIRVWSPPSFVRGRSHHTNVEEQKSWQGLVTSSPAPLPSLQITSTVLQPPFPSPGVFQIDQNRSKSIEIDQNRPKSIKIDQKRSKSIKNDQTNRWGFDPREETVQ